ncbi:hypothetical protein QTP88_024028 [Uroleucon formosanum]
MLGLDLKLDALEKRKEARVQNENKFREQMVETYEEFETETISSTSSEEEIQDVDNFENETIAGPSKCKRARKNLMTPRLTFALDKCKISDRDAIHIITACIEAASLNIDDFVLSRSSIKRARENFRKEGNYKMKSKFFDLNLNFVVIHWDSKILPDITGKANVDRLPVVATAPGLEQLLGVPALSSGTGLEISSAVYDNLQDWALLDKIQAFVVDTTASNTGRLNGACILLEQKLNRNILLLACRHHMYEVVLQGVFHETKLCVMSGPDIPIFKKFQKNWVNINKKNFSTWMTDSYVRDKLGYIALNILNFAENKIKEDFPRNDYRELLELIIIFLGGTPLNGIQFRQPGAYHLARWMAKAIYCFKIYIFRHQVKLNHREGIALRDICCFVITCYAENWFTCMDPIEAPLNDIFFLRKLVSYKDINPSIANVAIKKFFNHLWYLNEETVMFSIFDERILIEDKRRIVQIILQENYEEDLEVPKRITLKPEEIPEFIKRDIPFELFTTNSLKFFSRFKISSEFLNIDPVEWKNNLEYNNAREIISLIKVVYDTAERNVKLMEDFNQKITKNEEQKQFLLQVRQFSIHL